MPVPDTNTFSLQNVVDVVNPTTDDLVDCFADAISGDFDGSYSQDKDELDDFRNYGAVTYTSFTMLKVGYTTAFAACFDSSISVTKYHDGTGTHPVVGDKIYNTSNGSTIFNGGDEWYRYVAGSKALLIGTDGIVDTVTSC